MKRFLLLFVISSLLYVGILLGHGVPPTPHNAQRIKGKVVQDTTGNLVNNNIMIWNSTSGEWEYGAEAGASGTADSMGIDTDGDGTIDAYLYSTVAGAFHIKKGTDITLTVDTDTLTIAVAGVWLNVKNFGATGDSSTSDQVAIQAALDSAVALEGAVVDFPDGWYGCTVGFIIDIGWVSLVGDNSTLDFAALTTGSAISFVNTNDTYANDLPWAQTGRTIQGLRILGNDRTEPTIGIDYQVDNAQTELAHILIARVTVTQFGTGIHFTSNAYLINHINQMP